MWKCAVKLLTNRQACVVIIYAFQNMLFSSGWIYREWYYSRYVRTPGLVTARYETTNSAHRNVKAIIVVLCILKQTCNTVLTCVTRYITHTTWPRTDIRAFFTHAKMENILLLKNPYWQRGGPLCREFEIIDIATVSTFTSVKKGPRNCI